jgi:hypothetical protein
MIESCEEMNSNVLTCSIAILSHIINQINKIFYKNEKRGGILDNNYKN